MPGETVAVVGATGAGKTTLLRSIAGVLRNEAGMVVHRGQATGAIAADQIMLRGIAMVPEGRRLFHSLSVGENLPISGQVRRAAGPRNLQAICDLFPILQARRASPGTALSGGQQQMVAIGWALMSNPQMLPCDEISLGLGPVVIRDIYAAVARIEATGAALVIVEQDVGRALSVADRVYCMMQGRVTMAADAAGLSREAIHAACF